MVLYNEISKVLQRGETEEVQSLIKKGLEEGSKAEDILNEGLLKGMMEMGERWKKGEIFVPEVLIAAQAMGGAMEVLEEILIKDNVKTKGIVVIGTVKGDLHDIGKNLVAMMMKGAGYKVIDLGVDVSADTFIETAEEHNANFVCMSSLLTTTMPYIKTVIDEFKNRGLRDKYIIMAGGAPVTEEYVKEVGGDYYTKDAVEAADKLSEVMQ